MRNILIVIICIGTLSKGIGQCHATDFASLRAIYMATDGDNWINNNGWNLVRDNVVPPAQCNLDTLHGITLDVMGRVSEIDLGAFGAVGNNLVDSLPEEIGNLSNLKILDFSGNENLTGSLPNTIGNLSALEELKVPSCSFNGLIPNSFWSLTKLKYVSLSGNEFNGGLPNDIGNLDSLETLIINNVPFTGPLPDSIGGLLSLKELVMRSNSFTGSIPESIGQLSNLNYLSISNFRAANPVLFIGPIPQSIGNLPELKYLRLDGLDVDGQIPISFGNLDKLETLILRDLKVVGDIPCEIGDITKLKELTIVTNRDLSGVISDCFSNLDSLLELRLGANDLQGGIPLSIFELTQLTDLALNQNRLTGGLPSQIGQLVNLDNFSVAHNQLTGPLPEEIGDLSLIRFFDISINDFSGSIPTRIGDMTNLLEFKAEQNEFTGPLPSTIGMMTNLDNLDIRGSGLCGGLPAELGDLTNLTKISIGNDQLGGCYPSNLSNLCPTITLFFAGTQYEATWADFCNSGAGTCSGTQPHEYAALEDFYNELDGANWTVNKGWLVNNDPCGLGATEPWAGLDCDNGEQVSSITLTNNNLSGSLTESMGMFCELKVLNLSENAIDTISSGLSRAYKLRLLDLGENDLDNPNMVTNPFPINLVSLDLAHNNLTNLVEFDHLTSLEFFYANHNNINGQFPDYLTTLPLRVLQLNKNNLSGPLPQNMDDFTQLSVFRIDSNNIDGIIPPLLGNTPVVSMNLSSNNLTQCLHSNLQNICGAPGINISNNPSLTNDNWTSFCNADVGLCNAPFLNTWTGNSGDQMWNTSGNWSLMHVPTLFEKAYIPNGHTVNVLSNEFAQAALLEIETGVTFDISGEMNVDPND